MQVVEERGWDAPPRETREEEGLVVRLDGYEGPLAVLLDLARKQKVDLREVSVLALADQYLAFVEEAKAADLSLAADYLVMASWLTYLKSRLLLPEPAGGEEPSADEMAADLAFQLRRLDAMRRAGEALIARPRLGLDVFGRGRTSLSTQTETEWRADLHHLLSAYASARLRTIPPVHAPPPPPVLSIEAARARLSRSLSRDWTALTDLPAEAELPRSSIIASLFAAALEAAKTGGAELRQEAPFEPIYLRGRDG